MTDSLLRHIDPHRHDTLVRAGKAVGRLFDRVFLDISHDDVGARFRKCGRDSKADARSGTGHNGGLAGDVHEEGSLLFRLFDLFH